MPSLSATALAVVALSPVTMMILRPAAFNSRIASGVDSLIGSATPTMPAALPSTETSITVWPSFRSASARSSNGVGSTDKSRKSSAFPTATCLPETAPFTPFPVTELNLATSARVSFFASAPFTMAAAKGCSLERSRLATSCSRPDSSMPGWGMTELSVGLPSVRVPVLSMMSVSTLPNISNASALRIKIPARAPRPVPTIIAMGVASPRAHGQATIRTATAFTSA